LRFLLVLALAALGVILVLQAAREGSLPDRAGATRSSNPGQREDLGDGVAHDPSTGRKRWPVEQPELSEGPPRRDPKPFRVSDSIGAGEEGGIRVLVVDEGRAPIGGSEVRLFRCERRTRHRCVKRRTQSDGTVEERELRAGKWFVQVRFGSHTRITRVDVVEGRLTEVDIVIPRSGVAVYGIVRHASAGPLANARVTLMRHGLWFDDRHNVVGDEKGRYRFDSISPGAYDVEVHAGGRSRRCPHLTIAKPGPIRRDLVVGIETLGGRVLDASTGAPLSGVTVTLQGPDWLDTSTDREGTYGFFDLATGEAQLRFSRPGYGSRCVRTEVVAGENRRADARLCRAVRLHVRVFDETGVPVADSLRLTAIRSESSSTGFDIGIETDVDGHVLVESLTPGDYELRLRKEGGAHARPTVVTLAPGENAVDFRLDTARRARQALVAPAITGIVLNAATQRPVGGARVQLQDGSRRTDLTTASGAFTLSRLATGNHRLSVSKDGYGFHVQRGIRIERSDQTVSLEVRLQPAADLQLHVYDAQGRPVVGFLLLSLDPRDKGGTNVTRRIRAGNNGMATYRQVLPGRYRLRARVDELGESSLDVVILPGVNEVQLRLGTAAQR